MAEDRPSRRPRRRCARELRRLLERQIDDLPLAFRTVFVMREVEDMTVEETAECLAIPAATVRTRLFRARALLRESLARDIDIATSDVFAFAGARCDRIVAGVLAPAARDSAPSGHPAVRDACIGNGTASCTSNAARKQLERMQP